MISAVIFDLDGTLVTINCDYKALRAEVRSYLINQGVPTSVLSLNESIFGMLDKTEIFFRNNNKAEKVFEKIRKEVLKIAERSELNAARTISLPPSVIYILKNLKEKGLKIGLCTVSSEAAVKYIVEKFKIEKFFDAIIPRDKVEKVKPNSKHLQATIEALKVKAEEVLLIGDSVIDMKSAREINVIAVGLTTGISMRKELIAAGANYIITAITDVPTLIEQINKT